MTPTLPDSPFATALALKLLKIIQERDLQLLELRGKYDSNAKEQFSADLEALDGTTYDSILEACTGVLATADGVVKKVLEVEQQMRIVRMGEARGIGTAG
jgi:hypothetical protein